MQKLKVIGQLTAFEASLYVLQDVLSEKEVEWTKEACPHPFFLFLPL